MKPVTREQRIAYGVRVCHILMAGAAEQDMIQAGLSDAERAEARDLYWQQRQAQLERWESEGHPKFGGGHWG